MDLDKAFVSALLGNGKETLRDAVGKGIDEDALKGEGQKAFVFVLILNRLWWMCMPEPAMSIIGLGIKVACKLYI